MADTSASSPGASIGCIVPQALPVFQSVIEHIAIAVSPRRRLEAGTGDDNFAELQRAATASVADGPDLVLIGAALRRLPKSQGLDLLNALQYRAAWVLVLAPEFTVQPLGDEPVAVWSERDFAWHDLWAWDNTRAMSLFVLRGYRPSPLSIDRLVEQVNDSALPLLDLDGSTLVRPCRLRLVDHAREVGYRVR